MSRAHEDWERLGSVQPYFAVLTDERFLLENLTPQNLGEFYATGERDVDMLLALASSGREAPLSPRNTLEFGCGVGRLTTALARRSGSVVAVDAAPSMLDLARSAAGAARLGNITFIRSDALGILEAGTFDFICSYIVFQHIPTVEGEAYLRKLLRLAAPTSVVALHFVLRRPGGALRRFLRWMRARSRTVHSIARAIRNERDLPYIQMNEYSRARITRLLGDAGFGAPSIVATDHGGIDGAIFVARRAEKA
jgi:ubiquinone/menaquinone biosynthesis C-methylase UbiE